MTAHGMVYSDMSKPCRKCDVATKSGILYQTMTVEKTGVAMEPAMEPVISGKHRRRIFSEGNEWTE